MVETRCIRAASRLWGFGMGVTDSDGVSWSGTSCQCAGEASGSMEEAWNTDEFPSLVQSDWGVAQAGRFMIEPGPALGPQLGLELQCSLGSSNSELGMKRPRP